MLVPGPFLWAMVILAGLQRQEPPQQLSHRGAATAGAGTSKRPKNSDKVTQCERRVGRRMASQARKKARPGAAPGQACLHSEANIAAGQIEGKAVDQFHFLGKITAEIRGRATRTERELNVD